MDGLARNCVTVGAESLHCADELLTSTVGFQGLRRFLQFCITSASHAEGPGFIHQWVYSQVLKLDYSLWHYFSPRKCLQPSTSTTVRYPDRLRTSQPTSVARWGLCSM